MVIYNSHETSTGNLTLAKGNQIKVQVGDNWYKADLYGYEGAAEIAVADLLKQSNITNIVSFAEYDYEKITLNEYKYNGCVSKDFTNGKDIVTLDEFIKKVTGKTPAEYFRKMTPTEAIKDTVNLVEKHTGITNFGQYLTAMFELDRFVYNEDRHFNNIALLRDGNNFELCPIFDNGASFLSDTNVYCETEKIGRLRNSVKSKPFSSSFDKQVNICRELYGPQLIFDKDLSLSPDVEYDIATRYGDRILERIQNTIEYSKNMCSEMLKDSEELER